MCTTPTPPQTPSLATAAAATVAAATASCPPGMNEEWYLALRRLQAAAPGATFGEADSALARADGDELDALGLLTVAASSELQRERERAVEAARAAGDSGRVSALKEAELRRLATGSARDYFKGYVDVAGAHVDSGYVDESADFIGRAGRKLRKWFGGGGD
jgi:hypothetical protein